MKVLVLKLKYFIPVKIGKVFFAFVSILMRERGLPWKNYSSLKYFPFPCDSQYTFNGAKLNLKTHLSHFNNEDKKH